MHVKSTEIHVSRLYMHKSSHSVCLQSRLMPHVLQDDPKIVPPDRSRSTRRGSCCRHVEPEADPPLQPDAESVCSETSWSAALKNFLQQKNTTATRLHQLLPTGYIVTVICFALFPQCRRVTFINGRWSLWMSSCWTKRSEWLRCLFPEQSRWSVSAR